MAKSKEQIIRSIKSSLRKAHPKWSEDKVKESAFKIYNARDKATSRKEFIYNKEDEDFRVFGFIRTTIPDTEGDVSPVSTLQRWAEQINGSFAEANKGDYHHDRGDNQLISVAEYAEVLPLSDKPGHHGLWVSDFVNAKHRNFDTVKYEMENNMLPAYSVEFNSSHMTKIGDYSVITPECDLWVTHTQAGLSTSML